MQTFLDKWGSNKQVNLQQIENDLPPTMLQHQQHHQQQQQQQQQHHHHHQQQKRQGILIYFICQRNSCFTPPLFCSHFRWSIFFWSSPR